MKKQELIEKLQAANVPLTGKEKVKDLEKLFSLLPQDLQPVNEEETSEDGELEIKDKYNLLVSFNNLTFEFNTNNLFDSFRQIPKPFLKTKVLVKVVSPDGKKGEKALMGPMARNLFRNDTALRVFFKRLLLK